jgi:N-acetylmuramoyl-L-alanine amidase
MRYFKRLIIGMVFALTWPAAALALQVTGISIQNQGNVEIVTVSLSDNASGTVFALDKPPRLVVDLPPFTWHVPASDIQNSRSQLVKNIRYARFNENTSRLVFDLEQKVDFQQLGAPGDSYQLQFQLNLPQGMAAAPAYSPPQAGTPPPQPRPVVAAPPPLDSAAPVYTPVPVEKPCRSDLPLIAIDAGHGGQDPGATGKGGTKEKYVTLEYARALADALKATGRYRVMLTRDGDYFILLRERVKIAKKAGADLFISLHADSAPSATARGFSVYTLSEEASDAEAAALAAQENKADVLGGMDLTHEDRDVADILIDLAQRDTKNKSINMAEGLVHKMKGQIPLLPNTHRYAGFAVLKAPDIPSALVEIGFLSNAEEERLIKSPDYRKKVIAGLVRGIDHYFENH